MTHPTRKRSERKCPRCMAAIGPGLRLCERCGYRPPRGERATRFLDRLWEYRATLFAVQLAGFFTLFCSGGLLFVPAAVGIPLLFAGVLAYYWIGSPARLKPAEQQRWRRETLVTLGELVLSLVLAGLYGGLLWFLANVRNA